ncbi:MAG TPA: ribosome maturation factor RimM [Gemmatimonadales bacterium]|nr:ribosome maturation factor RimM [Gemmatimonadales bacterium]
MTDAGPRHVVVGRLRKPHGLKGETTLFPLTDSPDVVFAPGRTVLVLDLAGQVVGGPLEIERSRTYHREWLVKFRGIERREELEPLRAQFLGADADTLPPPADDEVYLHELEGFAVRLDDGTPVGLVSGMYELKQGLTLEVQGPKREFLLPYKKEFVRQVDRAGRSLTVVLPEGMLDL